MNKGTLAFPIKAPLKGEWGTDGFFFVFEDLFRYTGTKLWEQINLHGELDEWLGKETFQFKAGV